MQAVAAFRTRVNEGVLSEYLAATPWVRIKIPAKTGTSCHWIKSAWHCEKNSRCKTSTKNKHCFLKYINPDLQKL